LRKGEVLDNIDELHKEAFELLLKQRGLKHPGEEGAWALQQRLCMTSALAGFVEGSADEEKFVVATLRTAMWHS